jgi:hypothetical protein
MPHYYSLADPPRRTPAGHLESLRESLDRVGRHLREGLAEAAGRAAAGAVREAMSALLGDPHTRPAPAPVRGSAGHPPDLWDDTHEDLSPEWDDPDPGPAPATPPTTSPPPRWLAALSAGWRAGRWCLRRRPGRWPLLRAVGVGLGVGAAALVCGAFLPAGVGLVDSALNLAALADLARSGTVLLAGAL